MTPLTTILNDVVKAMQRETEVYFLAGRRSEIAEILGEKSGNSVLKYEKYPLIALFLNDNSEQITATGRETTVNLAIITETRPEWRTAERIDNTFVPILYPLMELFFKYLNRSPYVYAESVRTYERKDHFGLDSSNVLNDIIDAVEITGLQLQLLIC